MPPEHSVKLMYPVGTPPVLEPEAPFGTLPVVVSDLLSVRPPHAARAVEMRAQAATGRSASFMVLGA
jgi:hypothetical protein